MTSTVKVNAELLSKAQLLSGFKTRKAVAEEALKLLIMLNRQSDIKTLKGKLNWSGDWIQMRVNK
jgi:hypothetical protein